MTNNQNLSETNIRVLIGKNLKRLRLEAGLSKSALAEKSDITYTFINDVEKGKKWISCKTLARLCGILEADPIQFFFPLSEEKEENTQILSAYIDEFTDTALKNVEDFKNRYSLVRV